MRSEELHGGLGIRSEELQGGLGKVDSCWDGNNSRKPSYVILKTVTVTVLARE